MYIQIRNYNEIPRIKSQNTYPAQYVINLITENKSKLKLNKDSRKILEHIEIVKEARMLYSKAKVITWEDFFRNES